MPKDDVMCLIKPFVSDLQSEELFRRKSALKELNRILFSDNNFSEQAYHETFSECYMQVLKCFRDKSETCREISIEIMTNFIQNLEVNDYYLTYIFPAIVERIGTVELIEESEELRLELVNFLIAIIERYKNTNQLVPFLNDCILILCQTVIDKYPKVKEISCKCIIELADALPRHFHMQCESLIEPVLKNFSHQHFRIRVISINTIGVLILHSTSSSIIEKSVGSLAERLFDQNAHVRRTIAQVAAKLLTEYRDRYSHFHRILPLILTGLCDEVPDTRQEVEELWNKAGEQYEKENEQDLKDLLDFPVAPPSNYPTDLKRPRLGCRTLVQRNYTKMTAALSSELSSWQDDIRIRCAQLLCVIALHCEDYITQGLQNILPAMYNACEQYKNRDDVVRVNVMAAGTYVGIFVPAKSWSKLILPATEDAPTCGHLRVLRSVLSGTTSSELFPIAQEIADLLFMEEVRCANRNSHYQQELVECCRILISFPSIASQVFTILLTAVALSSQLKNEESGDYITVADKARELLENLEGKEKLLGETLERLNKPDVPITNALSTDRCIFDTILFEWGKYLIPYLPLVTGVLSRCLEINQDSMSRLKTFQALSTFLNAETLSNTKCEQTPIFVESLIKDILQPALVWSAGRSAEALRTAASYCLTQTLVHVPVSFTNCEAIYQSLITTITSLTDDASWMTRMYAAKSMSGLGNVLRNNGDSKIKTWANIACTTLVKHLDDPNDNVRQQVLKSLKHVSESAQFLEPVNLKFLVDSVLTHMDDSDENVHITVFDILKSTGTADSQYLKEKLAKEKHFFKNEEICHELITYLDSINIK